MWIWDVVSIPIVFILGELHSWRWLSFQIDLNAFFFFFSKDDSK